MAFIMILVAFRFLQLDSVSSCWILQANEFFSSIQIKTLSSPYPSSSPGLLLSVTLLVDLELYFSII